VKEEIMAEKRSDKKRRIPPSRRKVKKDHGGPERRCGIERRKLSERRRSK